MRSSADRPRRYPPLLFNITSGFCSGSLEPRLFVFCSRGRDKIKIVYWERSGFVLWYKRLEKERFPWPRRDEQGVVAMTGRELNWLLDGIDLFRLRAHAELSYQSVA